jgi:hypothetical protein
MSSLLVSKLARSPRLAVLQLQDMSPASQKAQNLQQCRLLCLFVTQVGQNWNQLVWELNGWLLFGRELENISNNTEVGAF